MAPSAAPLTADPRASSAHVLAFTPVQELLDEAYRLAYCLVGPGLPADRVCAQATRGLGLRPIGGAASPLLRWSLLRRVIGHAERDVRLSAPLISAPAADDAGSFVAVWRLPWPQRTVIALQLVAALDSAEIANLLRLPTATVRVHGDAGRRSLRSHAARGREPGSVGNR